MAVHAVLFRVQLQAAKRLAGDQPIERKIRVVAGNACRVRPRPYGYSSFEHASDRRSPLSVSCSVAIHKVFALERHPGLHRAPAIEGLHAIELLIGDGFAMITEPAQA